MSEKKQLVVVGRKSPHEPDYTVDVDPSLALDDILNAIRRGDEPSYCEPEEPTDYLPLDDEPGYDESIRPYLY